MAKLLKPFVHLPLATIEVIMPKGTSTEAAVAAGGRAILAVKGLVARPIEVKVEAREMFTSLQLLNVETVPFVADARAVMEKIVRAVEG